jgi:hypothetical protein
MQATQFKTADDTASKLVYTPRLDNATPENTEKGRALEVIANLKQFFKKEETAETNHSTDSLPVGLRDNTENNKTLEIIAQKADVGYSTAFKYDAIQRKYT